MKQLNESTTQTAILREFGTRSDMRLWRANSGSAVIRGRLVKFGIPGQADLTGILPDGRRLEVEVKSEFGQQTPEQANYQAMIERFGGVYILARSIEDVWDGIEKSNVTGQKIDKPLPLRHPPPPR